MYEAYELFRVSFNRTNFRSWRCGEERAGLATGSYFLSSNQTTKKADQDPTPRSAFTIQNRKIPLVHLTFRAITG